MAKDIMKLQNGSDIRGIALDGVAGEEVNFTEIEAGAIASAFVQWLAPRVHKPIFGLNICIGRDPRLSGEVLVNGLKKGICMMGSKVEDAGLASTPAMFKSIVMPFWEFDGAIMVTASHLPFNRNGLKFFTAEGGLDKDDIKDILAKASKISFIGDFYESDSANVMDMYAASLRQFINAQCRDLHGMKIAVDAGNGSAGFFARDVLARLGADVSCSQFLDPDGTFPNHQPNPENPDAMASICKRVVETGADIGIIFDTDVDRSSAVTPSGKPLARNEIVALAAALVAADHPGGTVVTDSVTSNELHDFLENELGLKHLRYKRGYKNVINKALELRESGEDAFLAIETSGHAAYSDNYFLDDGAYLAVLIIIAATKLKREGKTIDSLIDRLEAPAESIERRFNITCEDFQSVGTIVLEDMEAWVSENQRQRSYEISNPAASEDIESSVSNNQGQRSYEISNPAASEDIEASVSNNQGQRSYEISNPAASEDIEASVSNNTEASDAGSKDSGFGYGANSCTSRGLTLELVRPNYEGLRVNYSIKLNNPSVIVQADDDNVDSLTASGWFLLRKSLHDPVLPLNIESDTIGGTAAMLAVIEEFMSNYPEIK